MTETREMLKRMRNQLTDLYKQIYTTPKWRKIKRYRLLETLYKLESDYDLVRHVLLDDEE